MAHSTGRPQDSPDGLQKYQPGHLISEQCKHFAATDSRAQILQIVPELSAVYFSLKMNIYLSIRP
jgi:hypothetical protein